MTEAIQLPIALEKELDPVRSDSGEIDIRPRTAMMMEAIEALQGRLAKTIRDRSIELSSPPRGRPVQNHGEVTLTGGNEFTNMLPR